MAHPLIPEIIALANPIADTLNLEVVNAIFHTNQSPPVLRVDIRNRQQETSLNNCEQMSRSLEAALDAANLIPDTYILEISSPGISQFLTTERDFASFKGFPVVVTTSKPYKNRQEWIGQLMHRNENAIHINRKGCAIAIPLSLVVKVQLAEP